MITVARKLLAAGLVLAAASSTAFAAEITLLAGAPFRAFGLEVLPTFEQSSRHKVMPTWLGGPQSLELLKGNEVVDVVILNAAGSDELVRANKLKDPAKLAMSQVGVAVRAGARRPDISSADAIRDALVAAKSIAYSSGTSGVAIGHLFERLGIVEKVKDKVKQVRGEPVGEVIARGEAEIGFHQIPELLPVKGIDIVGPLPASVEPPIVFTISVHTKAKEPAAAQDLVKFLSSRETHGLLKKHGIEPM